MKHLDSSGNVLCEATSAVVGTSESTIDCGKVKYTTKGGGMSKTTSRAIEKAAEGAAYGAAKGMMPIPLGGFSNVLVEDLRAEGEQ